MRELLKIQRFHVNKGVSAPDFQLMSLKPSEYSYEGIAIKEG